MTTELVLYRDNVRWMMPIIVISMRVRLIETSGAFANLGISCGQCAAAMNRLGDAAAAFAGPEFRFLRAVWWFIRYGEWLR